MNPILRNILAVLAGIVAGSAVNMGLIMLSPSVIPPPDGADVTTAEGLKASMHLFEPKHFIMPFLAHALGTLAGAILTVRLAVDRRPLFAYPVAAFFLLGGIMNILMLPSPMWFTVTDLVLAYLPMGYLATLIGGSKNPIAG